MATEIIPPDSDQAWAGIMDEVVEHNGVSGEMAVLLTAVRAWIISSGGPGFVGSVEVERGDEHEIEWLVFNAPDGTSYSADMGDSGTWDAGEAPYERMVWELLHVNVFGDWRDRVPLQDLTKGSTP